MNKLVILTTDDTMKTVDYKGYDTINEAVGGFIEHIGNLPNTSDTFISFYCNEEFMLKNDEQFDKFNALAYLICDNIIYGNVAVIVDPDYEQCDDGSVTERGLTEEEINLLKTYVQSVINDSKVKPDELHKQYDGNKTHYNKGISAFNMSLKDFMEAMNEYYREDN